MECATLRISYHAFEPLPDIIRGRERVNIRLMDSAAKPNLEMRFHKPPKTVSLWPYQVQSQYFLPCESLCHSPCVRGSDHQCRMALWPAGLSPH